jgi:hypothetical protein
VSFPLECGEVSVSILLNSMRLVVEEVSCFNQRKTPIKM